MPRSIIPQDKSVTHHATVVAESRARERTPDFGDSSTRLPIRRRLSIPSTPATPKRVRIDGDDEDAENTPGSEVVSSEESTVGGPGGPHAWYAPVRPHDGAWITETTTAFWIRPGWRSPVHAVPADWSVLLTVRSGHGAVITVENERSKLRAGETIIVDYESSWMIENMGSKDIQITIKLMDGLFF